MDSAQIGHIKETWKIPAAAPVDSGAAILIEFFKRFPSNHQKFPFKDVPVDELNNDKRFRAHAGRIVRVFDDSIKMLGEDGATAKLNEIWTKIATTHFSRQITKQSFNELKGVILDVLTLACNLDGTQQVAWSQLLDAIYEIIFQALDQLQLERH